MFNFLSLKTEAFGLDISDLSLKIVKLKKKGRFLEVESFGKEDIPPGTIKEGEIEKEKELAQIIKGALKKVKGRKITTKYVVTSLPEEKAFFQVIQMPKVSKEDLRSAVIYEAENYIPLPIEDVYLDYRVIPPLQNSLDHLDVLISAIPKDIAHPYVSCLKMADLEPVVLEIESLAIIRALVKNGVALSPILLIDFGATRTSFIIFSGYSLRFTSSIAVSSNDFTEIIARNLQVKREEAERLKIKYGLEEKIKLKIKDEQSKVKRERGKIFEALIPALVDLIQQIKKHLYYYQTHASHEHLPPPSKGGPQFADVKTGGQGVSKILLCGGGSNLKGLPEFLSSELKIPVELGNPLVNILAKEKKGALGLSFEEALGYTTTFGLALRGIKLKTLEEEQND